MVREGLWSLVVCDQQLYVQQEPMLLLLQLLQDSKVGSHLLHIPSSSSSCCCRCESSITRLLQLLRKFLLSRSPSSEGLRRMCQSYDRQRLKEFVQLRAAMQNKQNCFSLCCVPAFALIIPLATGSQAPENAANNITSMPLGFRV